VCLRLSAAKTFFLLRILDAARGRDLLSGRQRSVGAALKRAIDQSPQLMRLARDAQRYHRVTLIERVELLFRMKGRVSLDRRYALFPPAFIPLLSDF